MVSKQAHWFTEKQSSDLKWSCRIKRTLFSKQSSFQQIDIYETEAFGRMLVLDGVVMTTEKDEFAYHELLTHVALNTHKSPKHILVIGGGDGGAIREVLRYPMVQRVVLAEIDEEVVKAAKEFFPTLSSGFTDPRVEIRFVDGAEFIKGKNQEFDIIFIDNSEPIGPSTPLFEHSFYKRVYDALKPDGLMVAQTESPWINQLLIRQVFQHLASIFPITRLYVGFVPTYPSGAWTFTLASKHDDPLTVDPSNLHAPKNTKYYHPSLHHSLFQLPNFIKEILFSDLG